MWTFSFLERWNMIAHESLNPGSMLPGFQTLAAAVTSYNDVIVCSSEGHYFRSS